MAGTENIWRRFVNLFMCACSCCVDEVAADHVSANAIIHFGTACLTV